MQDNNCVVSALLRITETELGEGQPKDYEGIDEETGAVALKNVTIDKTASIISFMWKKQGEKKGAKFSFMVDKEKKNIYNQVVKDAKEPKKYTLDVKLAKKKESKKQAEESEGQS